MALYAVAVILANPLLSLGLFYIVLAVWLILAIVALRPGRSRGQRAAEGLLLAVLVWIIAVVPLMMFQVILGAVLWYAGELASIALGTWVVANAAREHVAARGHAASLRRLGLASGLATAFLLLVPFATLLLPDLEAAALSDPILRFLLYVPMLATAVLAAVGFALVPGATRRAGAH